MADVRSMLRNERATRRIEHTNASYSATGTLQCNACQVPVKSELEAWNKHLRSSQHAMRAERLRVSSGKPAGQSTSSDGDRRLLHSAAKKRKAEDEDEEDSRKKNKPARESPTGRSDTVAGSGPTVVSNNDTIASSTTAGQEQLQALPSRQATITKPEPIQTIDEDEWAAFERDLAKEASPEAPSALTASATISAAPLSTAEAAAQDSMDNDEKRVDQRAVELEAEREDAARALEEEFDEMDKLEERVKRLKNQREDFRKKRVEKAGTEEISPKPNDNPPKDEEDEDEDDSDADIDEWGMWRR